MNRRGLTLTEVLIAVVILGIVGVGITRLLSSQMRFFGRAANERDARAVSRNALNLVRQEMRMIEPRGIVAASSDSLRVRVPYAVGLHCTSGTVTFAAVDSLVWATAVYGGYAYRDTLTSSTMTYVPAAGNSLSNGSAATCTGVSVTPVPGGQLRVLAPAFPITTTGATVLLYQEITYRFAASSLVSGRTALWRRVAGGNNEEVAVPFDATSRFRFYNSGATTAADTVPTLLRNMTGVELVLRGESERTSPGTTTPVEELIRVPIFFRNAVQ